MTKYNILYCFKIHICHRKYLKFKSQNQNWLVTWLDIRTHPITVDVFTLTGWACCLRSIFMWFSLSPWDSCSLLSCVQRKIIIALLTLLWTNSRKKVRSVTELFRHWKTLRFLLWLQHIWESIFRHKLTAKTWPYLPHVPRAQEQHHPMCHFAKGSHGSHAQCAQETRCGKVLKTGLLLKYAFMAHS